MRGILRLLRAVIVACLLTIVLPGRAHAWDVTYCVDVDVDYSAYDGGDRWTDNSVNKPAAGFNYYLDVAVGGDRFGNLDEDGCVVETGISGSCQLTINETFGFFSTSGNQGVHQDAGPVVLTNRLINSNQTVNETITYSDEAYAQLVLVANAIAMRDAGLTNETFVIDHDGCCSYDGQIHLSATQDNKFRIASLLGENVAEFKLGATALTTTLADDDDCDGGAGWLRKKHQSEAIVAGIAGFYSLAIWNDNDQSDCDMRSLSAVDFDLDLTNDFLVQDDIPCAYNEDPDGGSPDHTDGEDWLHDLIVANDGAPECDGEYVDRSTEYDWRRYLWNLHAFGDDTTAGNGGNLSVSQIFNLYVDVDPSTWDSNGEDPPSADDPWQLWHAEADSQHHDQHDLWYPGVDH